MGFCFTESAVRHYVLSKRGKVACFKNILTGNVITHTKTFVFFLPASTHFVPFPVYLALHAQEYDPWAFVHTAFTSQQ